VVAGGFRRLRHRRFHLLTGSALVRGLLAGFLPRLLLLLTGAAMLPLMVAAIAVVSGFSHFKVTHRHVRRGELGRQYRQMVAQGVAAAGGAGLQQDIQSVSGFAKLDDYFAEIRRTDRNDYLAWGRSGVRLCGIVCDELRQLRQRNPRDRCGELAKRGRKLGKGRSCARLQVNRVLPKGFASHGSIAGRFTGSGHRVV